ncbi:hypothetical protein CDAR_280121 [Caerostris darwini]|uniref:Uncharacterized protein n=1 Tax=Caerostris darwini TaxID=1538125 RepID=A0AAV4S8T6_9ARAC|nr:hypothetical protein CDAR_280121 [Caerostris darwini]
MDEENFRISFPFRTRLPLSEPHVSQIRSKVTPGVVSGTNRRSVSCSLFRFGVVRRKFLALKKMTMVTDSGKQATSLTGCSRQWMG